MYYYCRHTQIDIEQSTQNSFGIGSFHENYILKRANTRECEIRNDIDHFTLCLFTMRYEIIMLIVNGAVKYCTDALEPNTHTGA